MAARCVGDTLRLVEPSVPFIAAWASRGKVTRAGRSARLANRDACTTPARERIELVTNMVGCTIAI
jgi:hypothetical protein